jgi:hypothetical protein
MVRIDPPRYHHPFQESTSLTVAVWQKGKKVGANKSNLTAIFATAAA